MRTPKQIAASRANGAKSRGPKTPEGKAIASRNSSKSTGPNTAHGKSIASQNALRHGYLAESVVLPTESTAAFNAVVADLCRELQPETPIEYRLIEIMAVTDWLACASGALKWPTSPTRSSPSSAPLTQFLRTKPPASP